MNFIKNKVVDFELVRLEYDFSNATKAKVFYCSVGSSFRKIEEEVQFYHNDLRYIVETEARNFLQGLLHPQIEEQIRAKNITIFNFGDPKKDKGFAEAQVLVVVNSKFSFVAKVNIDLEPEIMLEFENRLYD